MGEILINPVRTLFTTALILAPRTVVGLVR